MKKLKLQKYKIKTTFKKEYPVKRQRKNTLEMKL